MEGLNQQIETMLDEKLKMHHDDIKFQLQE